MQIWYLFKVLTTEKIQTNIYRDQIVSAELKCLSTNKPQMFIFIFITNRVLDIQTWYLFRIWTPEQIPLQHYL